MVNHSDFLRFILQLLFEIEMFEESQLGPTLFMEGAALLSEGL